ncbi:MAG: UDP-N-acetylmuramoyl-tripeptide--D-alanyl-D-alanine ligase [Deltaproteobacteria bacterium]|nr:UDP-N-acetylmuramoyl-tripeptide--D-alanyl-D-alanine ligase [Deltaproteobacteria bacterium]
MAARRGTGGFVVSRAAASRRFSKGRRNVIRVPDTLKALGDLASYWRGRFDIPVVAVTGSNGKTTTKEMIAALLATRYPVLKTEGNFNNLIGLPLTLFRLTPRHRVAVLEMGMSVPGEIRRLTEIASPGVGVITHIGRAHLKGLKNIRGIARAKGELLEGLPQSGIAFLNRDDRFFRFLKKRTRAAVRTFGWKKGADLSVGRFESLGIRGERFEVRSGKRRAPFSLQILGRGNVSNALAAIGVGDYFKISPKRMQQALFGLRPTCGRLEPICLKNWTILNDSYNANPDSMTQALDVLQELKGTRSRGVAILGEMAELSRLASRCHQEIGAKAIRRKIDLLIGLGRYAGDFRRGAIKAGARPGQIVSLRGVRENFARIPGLLKRGDLILVKGSHAMQMDRLVKILRN